MTSHLDIGVCFVHVHQCVWIYTAMKMYDCIRELTLQKARLAIFHHSSAQHDRIIMLFLACVPYVNMKQYVSHGDSKCY